MKPELLEPRRVRTPRGPYGWVDLRVITQGTLERLSGDARVTYLFLCAVGNSQGLSFWGHTRIERILGLNGVALRAALQELQEGDLIVRAERIVQVLPLPEAATARPDYPVIGTRLRPAQAHTPHESVVVSDALVRSFEEEAGRRLRRITGRDPLASAVQALARSLALDQALALPLAAGGGRHG